LATGLSRGVNRPSALINTLRHAHDSFTNMASAARCARDQVSFAAVAIDEARENAAKNIQIHGGTSTGVQPEPHLFVERP
jgi:hypothetical protein